MQRFVFRRVSSETNFLRLQKRCCTLSPPPPPPPDYYKAPTPVPVMPSFDYTPPKYTGKSAEEILANRKKFLFPTLAPTYNKPLSLVAGKNQYVFDENGKRYLDAFAGAAVASCGHCHDDVVNSVVKQMKLLQHTSLLYLNQVITDYAEALVSKMPENSNLKVVYFTNSGTEANELALLLATLKTQCNDIISLRKGYYGLSPATMGANGLSKNKFNRVQTGIQHALNPDPYRGDFGSDLEKYVNDVQGIIDFETSGKVAGFISEAIQGVGGVLELVPGYLPAVYKIIREAGGLCIADEAITGFGRTGSHFWGFENHGVVPDIVTMAKGIGNGNPLGAVVTTPEIAQVLNDHSYYSTFGGNQVSTAAGLAVLDVIEKESLQRNAEVTGTYLKNRLIELKQRHKLIGDVRGRGFMLGVEFVTDRDLKTPAAKEAAYIMEEMKEMGVLVGIGGFHKNVFRITPPLCFTPDDADYLVKVMDHIMSKMCMCG